MTQRRSKSEEPVVPPISAAAWGTPREDFCVPGVHGLVVFHAGKRALVEPQIRALMNNDAPIDWEG